jgi:hypothetical protein
MAQEKPVHEVRLGKIKAAIWLNQTDNGNRYNVTFSRIYKTDGGWESSTSFGRDELPLLAKVADMAHTWTYQQGERSDQQASASNKQERRVSKATA